MTDRNKLKLVSHQRESSLEQQVVVEAPPQRGPRTKLNILFFLLFTILGTAATSGTTQLLPETLQKGDVGKRTRKDIVARRAFTFVPDRELLAIKAEEAARGVRAVYSFRRNGWLDLWQHGIKYGFRALSDPIFRDRDELARERFNALVGISLDKVTFWSLNNSVGFPRLKMILQTLFTNVLKDKILTEEIDTLRKKHPGGIEILVYNREGGRYNDKPVKVFTGRQYRELVDLSKLSALLLSEIETRYSLGDKNNLDRDARKALHTISLLLVQAHLQPRGDARGLGILYRPEITKQRRLEVKRKVILAPRHFTKGDVIVRAGDRITLETVKIFRTMIPPLWQRLFWFAGDFLLLSVFFLIIGWFATLKFGGRRGVTKDFYVAGALFLFFLGLVRGASFLIHQVFHAADPLLHAAIFPAAGAAFLIKILMGNRFAVFFSIAIAFLSAWAIGAPVHVALFYFLTGLAAAGASDRVEHRYVIWKAGSMIIAINLALIVSLRLVNGELWNTTTFWYLLAGFGGGVLMVVLMSALLPVVESLGDYITDIKLLELTNTDHPLLQELQEKSPGTYMHSQTVAQLAFSAAKCVGANALLVKVAAFYHDVGKTRQPRFFIENQHGENPHDKLKPSMSALVIRNHIKDTREILEKAGIPELIIDVASSHHGTTMIEYFYNKAKELAGPEEIVSEEDYRYPGPIPQTREAGILMLADAVEAAVRSRVKSAALKGKDQRPQQFDVNTIKAVVQSIVNKKFTDGQLDACELTLRDLSSIAASFISSLSSIHHERVSYPGPPVEKANVHRRPSQALPVVKPEAEGDAKKESKKTPPKGRTGGK